MACMRLSRGVGYYTGAGKRLFWRFQVEEPLDDGGHLFLVHFLWSLLEFASEEAGNSTSNALRCFLEHMILVSRKRPAFVLKGVKFLPANFIQTLAQGDDRRDDTLGLQLALETR